MQVAQGGPFYPTTIVQEWMLFAAAVLMAVIMGVPWVRRGRALAVANLLSFEMLLLPVFALLAYLTADPVYAQAARETFFTWPAAAILVAPTYAIYKVAALARSGSRLLAVVPSASAVFVLVDVIATASSGPATGTGLDLRVFLSGSLSLAGVPGGLVLAVGAAGALLYLSMTVYASWEGPGATLGRNGPLLVAVSASVVAFASTLLVVQEGALAQYLLAVPTSALLVASWVLARVL